MKKTITLPILLCLSSLALLAQPEWMMFHASDAVSGFQLRDGHIWVSSGSGLHKLNTATGERTTFNSSNSDLPGHGGNDLGVNGNGAVWLAGAGDYTTNYLSRFDGANWETWTTINGFDIDGVLHLVADHQDKAWFFGAFNQAALLVYENGNFTPIAPPGPEWLFMNGTYTPIEATTDGHLWAMFRDSAFEEFPIGEYDGNTWTFHDLTALGAPYPYSYKFHADEQNNLLVLSGDLDGSTIFKYDGQNWTTIDAAFNVNDFLNTKQPMYTDAQGNLWCSLWNNTLVRYDGQNWATTDMADLGLTGGHPEQFSIDETGNWWFIYVFETPYNYRKVLYKYDGNALQQVDLSNAGLFTNNILSLLIDPLQNKWAKSYSELIKFDGADWETHTFEPYSSYTLPPSAADRWGNLWFSGAVSFVGRYDGLAFTKIDVYDPSGQPLDYPGNLVVKKDGTVYFATGAQAIIAYKNGETSYLDSMNTTVWGSPFDDVSYHVALDTADRLWSLGYALHRLDGNAWTEIPLWEQNIFGGVDWFVMDPQNRVWVSYGISLPGAGSSYQVYDGTTWQPFGMPFEDRTLPVWDAQGNMWVGGALGLYKYDGSNWTNYNIFNSELPYNEVQDLKIDEYSNLWLAFQYAGLAVFNENGLQNIDAKQLPVLSGTIYRDLNGNQQNDPDDLPLGFHRAFLLPDSVATFSNFEGIYQFRLPTGDYEVQYLPIPNWNVELGAPNSYNISLGSAGQSGLNFRVAPEEDVHAGNILLTGGFPRCNQAVGYWLDWRNLGTFTENGQAQLTLDPKVEFLYSFPAPEQVNGNVLTWDYADLVPFDSRQVYLQLLMPNELATDSSLFFEAILVRTDPASGSVALDTNLLVQTVACSYDPNDKLAQPNGEVQDGQSLLGNALDYTIRFQNTGNDTAFTVVIRDTLEAGFDPNTLELLGASHPMTARLEPNGAMEFRFDHILLPDSTTNEAGSHGFVRYRVRARAGLSSPALLTNTAYIYFDLNQAVVTNTTANELVDQFVAVLEQEKDRVQLVLSPNPCSDWLQVALTEPAQTGFQWRIVDVRGSLVESGQFNGAHPLSLKVQQLPKGAYWLFLESAGEFASGKFVRQ